MNKIYTLIMFFVSICMSAQTLKGDVNHDGKLTIEDVTKVIDLYLNYEEPSNPDDNEQGSVLNGHEYVDLGLPSGIKWATCNVGAKSPEEYGDYFAWGETTPKSIYDWSTYKYMTGEYYDWRGCSKYQVADGNTDGVWYHGGTFIGDNKTRLSLEDDAAFVNWDGCWRMPSAEEFDELLSMCTWTLITQNGVLGYKVVGPNDKSIFLPAAGYRSVSSSITENLWGFYWTSSLRADDTNYPYFLKFNKSNVEKYYSSRSYGQSIRAVCFP